MLSDLHGGSFEIKTSLLPFMEQNIILHFLRSKQPDALEVKHHCLLF
jgi:hypothetical protein